MGDTQLETAETAIRAALEATSAATRAVQDLADHDVVASVNAAIDAAKFSLREGLRRLGRSPT